MVLDKTVSSTKAVDLTIVLSTKKIFIIQKKNLVYKKYTPLYFNGDSIFYKIFKIM